MIMEADFRRFDTSNSGSLDRDELQRLLVHQFGQEPSGGQVRAFNTWMGEMHVDDEGRVGLDAYITAVFGEGWYCGD